MAVGTIGQKPGNVIVPVTNLTKRTKWIPLVLTTDITCPQTGFAVTKCLAKFEADSAGQWSADLHAHFTWDSATVTSVVLTLVNMTMYNGLTSEISAELIGKGLAIGAAVNSNASTITLTCASTGTTTGAYVGGKVLLKQDPTTYTTAANMENVSNIAAYIPFGQTGSPGERLSGVGSSVTLNTSTLVTVASVTVTAGTWDLSSLLDTGGASSVTSMAFGIATANNSNTGHTYGDTAGRCTVSGTNGGGGCIPVVRKTVTTSTTYYLTAILAGAGADANGRITAIRVTP